MEKLDHISLEREIMAELDPAVLTTKHKPIIVRRETVLAVLSQSAQVSTDFCELLNEAGLLSAAALELEFFGHAQVQRTGSLTVSWGSVSDSNRNIDPVPTEIIWDSTRSGFGYAIEAGHPVLLADVAQETRFRDPQLVCDKICGGAICPIRYRDQEYGAIGVFSANRRDLTKEDVLFLQSVTLLLGPTRAHQKTERTLAEHSRFLSSAIDALDAMVVLLDVNGSVLQINRACQLWGGFTTNQLRGRTLWSAFFLPNAEATVRALIQDVGSDLGQRRIDAFFMSKHGEQRRVNWTIARLPNGSGDATFLATGIDITEQYTALVKLEEIEAKMAGAAEKQLASTMPKSETSTQGDSDASACERRKHDRRPYACVQLIAPCMEGKLPDRRAFREVRCHDISPRGFSFLVEVKPDFDELVVAFGSAQSQLFLRAKVKHISLFGQDGRNLLKVGCEYLGRVRLPWIAENAIAS